MFLQALSFYLACVLFLMLLFLYIGFCSFSMAFVEDIKLGLGDLNVEFIDNTSNSINKRIRLKNKFVKIIQFHADSKELSIVNQIQVINVTIL